MNWSKQMLERQAREELAHGNAHRDGPPVECAAIVHPETETVGFRFTSTWLHDLPEKPIGGTWHGRTLFVGLREAEPYYRALVDAGWKVVGSFVTEYIENQ